MRNHIKQSQTAHKLIMPGSVWYAPEWFNSYMIQNQVKLVRGLTQLRLHSAAGTAAFVTHVVHWWALPQWTVNSESKHCQSADSATLSQCHRGVYKLGKYRLAVPFTSFWSPVVIRLAEQLHSTITHHATVICWLRRKNSTQFRAFCTIQSNLYTYIDAVSIKTRSLNNFTIVCAQC